MLVFYTGFVVGICVRVGNDHCGGIGYYAKSVHKYFSIKISIKTEFYRGISLDLKDQ